jgi:hypothetical protein
VHDALAVRDRQRIGDSNADFEGFVQRHRTFAQSFGYSLTLQKLHHQVVGSILRADVIEMADVRMVQRRNGPSLALHALFQFRRRGKMGSKNFDRHGAIQPRIARPIDLAHAAST